MVRNLKLTWVLAALGLGAIAFLTACGSSSPKSFGEIDRCLNKYATVGSDGEPTDNLNAYGSDVFAWNTDGKGLDTVAENAGQGAGVIESVGEGQEITVVVERTDKDAERAAKQEEALGNLAGKAFGTSSDYPLYVTGNVLIFSTKDLSANEKDLLAKCGLAE